MPQPVAGPSTGGTTISIRAGTAIALIAVTQLMIILDTTIVTVALPHIQRSLHFSSSSLQWVVTAYTVVFGGLLLLGGRLGDVFGRRRLLVAGVLLFSLASLLGGFATSPAWLITTRMAQAVGAAAVAPSTLALIFTTLGHGRERDRAVNVYGAMSATGGAVGLIVGGLLTSYASWRWTLFVNVPIGLVIAVAAPRVLADTPRRPGRVDVLGAVAVTAGVASLIFALSSAAPSGPYDHAHFGVPRVVGGFCAGAVLIAAFVLIERRVRNPLLPLRIVADRNRAAVYCIMAAQSAAVFGTLYFLTLFLQEVWRYSPVLAGLAFLPWMAMFTLAATTSSRRLVERIGPRAVMMLGSVLGAAGLYWLSHVGPDDAYVVAVLGPVLMAGFGFGSGNLSRATIAMAGVGDADRGVASSSLNVSSQVGASVGIAGISTVAWTAVANRLHHHPATGVAVRHALAHGFDLAFLLAAGAAALAVVPALAVGRTAHAAGMGAKPVDRPSGRPAPRGSLYRKMARLTMPRQDWSTRATRSASRSPSPGSTSRSRRS
ncbi:MAG TPA: MFS transporter [Acidimicrobiales bacterium]|nr:MFS transporter [Acidimicrobiales bacterium]